MLGLLLFALLFACVRLGRAITVDFTNKGLSSHFAFEVHELFVKKAILTVALSTR